MQKIHSLLSSGVKLIVQLLLPMAALIAAFIYTIGYTPAALRMLGLITWLGVSLAGLDIMRSITGAWIRMREPKGDHGWHG